MGGEYDFFSRLCTPESERCRAVKSKPAAPVAGTPVLSLTNNFELVSSIKCEDWKSLSDHRLVVVEISQPAGKEKTKGREHLVKR